MSLLDFWLPGGPHEGKHLELVVYAHGLDFGKKAYGNLVELAALRAYVAQQLESVPARLVLHVKTAHVYEPELELMRSLTTPAAHRA